MIRIVLATVTLLLTMAGPAAKGELFKWVDEHGNTHYGDRPPRDAKPETVSGEINSYESVVVEPLDPEPTDDPPAVDSKSVIMFVTSRCELCQQAREHFRANGIPFDEHDIKKSETAAKAFKKLKGRAVPVILIGRKRMDGFHAETFDRIYNDKS
ncbi:MAG TPA: glutaredoxin family protein [Gammaproteobacteria bacterium]|jgi:glutaredoxin